MRRRLKKRRRRYYRRSRIKIRKKILFRRSFKRYLKKFRYRFKRKILAFARRRRIFRLSNKRYLKFFLRRAFRGLRRSKKKKLFLLRRHILFNYALRINIILKMSNEQKLAYLDQFSLSRKQKRQLLRRQ